MGSDKQRGFGMIEILIVASIGALMVFSIGEYLNFSLRLVNDDISRIEALYLAKASIEQARGARDEETGGDTQYGWSILYALTPSSPYYFQGDGLSPEKWMVQSGTATEGKYTVWVEFFNVERDANDDIVASGGVVDPNTLKVVSYVSWTARSGTKQVEVLEYLANFR